MKKLTLLITLFLLNGYALAETFHGTFEMDARGGSRKTKITFVYNLDLSNKQSISGDVSVTGGQTNCNRDYKLASGSIKGEYIVLVSESLEGHCGPFTFRGKLEGNELIGTIPYGGQPREITLRPS
jgi:hypothetical protein